MFNGEIARTFFHGLPVLHEAGQLARSIDWIGVAVFVVVRQSKLRTRSGPDPVIGKKPLMRTKTEDSSLVS